MHCPGCVGGGLADEERAERHDHGEQGGGKRAASSVVHLRSFGSWAVSGSIPGFAWPARAGVAFVMSGWGQHARLSAMDRQVDAQLSMSRRGWTNDRDEGGRYRAGIARRRRWPVSSKPLCASPRPVGTMRSNWSPRHEGALIRRVFTATATATAATTATAEQDRPPAIILGGRGTAVPVARSLGRAGISVYALGARSDAARFSRYCETFVDLGAGEGVQERWLSWLLRSAPRGSVLLPCADDGLELIARHRALLSENGLRAVDVDDRVVLAMLDKAHTYELAQDVGIPFPTSIVLSDDTDIHNAAEQMRFPCAMKPIESHHFARHFGVKALIVKDSAELYDAHRRTQALGMRMMLTDIIPGDDDQLVAYFSYLDDRGEPVFDFTSRKLRQFPPGFGLATYSLQAWEVEVAEVALRFLRGIGLRGLSYTEFKRDPRDGQLKLIECNNRFTIEMHGFHVDVPLFVYKRALGEGELLQNGYPACPHRRVSSTARLWQIGRTSNPGISGTRFLMSYRILYLGEKDGSHFGSGYAAYDALSIYTYFNGATSGRPWGIIYSVCLTGIRRLRQKFLEREAK